MNSSNFTGFSAICSAGTEFSIESRKKGFGHIATAKILALPLYMYFKPQYMSVSSDVFK